MHDDRPMVERRLERALVQRIRPAVYGATAPLTVAAWTAPGEPVPAAEALAQTFEPFEVGTAWGAPWSTTWFRLTGEIPAEWAGRRVEVVVDFGFSPEHGPGFSAEGLAYDPDGVPIKGIAPRNQYVPVSTSATAGQPVELYVEGAANPPVPGFAPTPLGDPETAGDEPMYRLARAELAVPDETVWHLVIDIEVLDGLMRELSPDDPRRHQILRALERMLDRLDLHDVTGTAAAARDELIEVLASPAHASAHRISAVGHAHIDSAWLWPLRETKRKCARTFANVTALAAEYPELVFACSQAQQYAWIKENQPALFERIRADVRNGQWAPAGGMWVESDANLPGSEALARQLIHGKRFFLDNFDYECEEVWLPDSFGYTAAFPQLARLAGARWFLTQKLSWNTTNKMPHHTFWWEGIDGTRVFTHFPPIDTYNSMLAGSELAHAVRNYSEKGYATRSLAPFGYGDGGGGPTREMLERARRLADLEGSPRVTVEPPARFFAAAEEEYPDAPVWSGEMYLELHRATYTTQAKTKSGNRRSEHLLREAELWATAAALHTGADYPYDELDRLWKIVLLHQFHDILPGSSIAWVHRQAREAYEQVRLDLEALIASTVGDDDGGVRVFNAAPHERAEVIAVPVELVAASVDGAEVAQKLHDGQVAAWATAPALGVGVAEPDLPGGPAIEPVTVRSTGDGYLLDNGLLRVLVDGDGLLASVVDLGSGREALPPGARGNLLQLHPDHPNMWDAWDIDAHYKRTVVDLTAADVVEVVDNGPLVAAVRVERSFGSSTVTQLLRLRAGARRVDVETEVDWHESEKVLKAAFPLDIHADRSTAEIQFGHLHRSTHTNTSWDSARFEIYAHRWMYVGEPGYGAAVLNDATYGHDVSRTSRPTGGTTTTIRLTLLRAPRYPDPETDQGRHLFRYALLPGATIGDAVAEGYALNLPLRAVPGDSAELPPVVTVDNPAVVVEAVKLADDRSGDLVVRLYESRGGRAVARVRAGVPVTGAAAVDLLERPLSPEQPLEVEGGGVELSLRPFQIMTLRFARS